MKDFEYLRTKLNERDEYARHMGFYIDEMREGYTRLIMEGNQYNMNILGIFHGGAIMSLADTAAGSCAATYGKVSMTLDMSVNFLKGNHGGKLIATSHAVRVGHRTAICRVDVTDEAENMIAIAQVTMYRTDKPLSVEGWMHD